MLLFFIQKLHELTLNKKKLFFWDMLYNYKSTNFMKTWRKLNILNTHSKTCNKSNKNKHINNSN